MNTDSHEVSVFKSGEPDAFAKAVELLEAARIPYRVVDKCEGQNTDDPRTVHWILVPEMSADGASQAIADVPSETLITFSDPEDFWPRMVWVQIGWIFILILLIMIAVAAIILVIQACVKT